MSKKGKVYHKKGGLRIRAGTFSVLFISIIISLFIDSDSVYGSEDLSDIEINIEDPPTPAQPTPAQPITSTTQHQHNHHHLNLLQLLSQAYSDLFHFLLQT